MTDWDLLERFTRTRCNRAFGELVARHAGFVYGACRRRLRDSHLAEDVTQAVFVVLARRPPARRDGAALAGWLYQTAIYACNNAIRTERLRTRHEHKAMEQHDRAIAASQSPAAISPDVEAQLDEALATLSAGDRDVLLLRYYQDLDLREIGAALGLSESAASKRATRALDRLRTTFERLGQQALSVSVVTEFLRQPAPPGLIERTTSASLSAGAGVAVESITNGVIHIMSNVKAKLIASAVAATLVVAGGATLSVSMLFAQAAPPAATRPAPANDGTPIDALRAFIETYKRYDAPGIRTMTVATDERARRMADAMCAYVQAGHDIRKAITDQFGPDAVEQLPELNSINPMDYLTQIDDELLEQFEQRVEENEATLVAPDQQSDEFKLVRTKNGWKISVDRMTETWTPEQTDERTGKVKLATSAVELLRKQIASGTLTSVDEVRYEIERLPGYGR